MLTDDIPNLRDLHKTLVDASELMAAFVGCANGNEQPPASMIEAASKSKEELAEWRLFFESVCEMVEVGERH